MRGRRSWFKAVEGACKAISMGCEDDTNTECYNHTGSQYIQGVNKQVVNSIFQHMPCHKGIVILPLVLPDTFTFGLYHTVPLAFTALMDFLWQREKQNWFICSSADKITFKILKSTEGRWSVAHSVETGFPLRIDILWYTASLWSPAGIIRQITTQKYSMKLHFQKAKYN